MQSYGPDYSQDGHQPGYNALGYIYSPTNGVKSYGDVLYYSDRGFLHEFHMTKSYSG